MMGIHNQVKGHYPPLTTNMQQLIGIPQFRNIFGGLPAKMEAQVDTLCFLAEPKEGQQQIKK